MPAFNTVEEVNCPGRQSLTFHTWEIKLSVRLLLSFCFLGHKPQGFV